ncbi:MAG: adenylosuccinate lyase [Eubacteriales bacterium]|nr:adenylosuccinate lyase [Eubacteriales bacterium]
MRDRYESPLCERYASARMQYIFSPDFKFTSWRKMWLYLAEAEKELGLDITDEQLDEIRAHLNDVDYDAAAAYEKRLRHDVMAHLRAFADQCPKAGPILHLGATSCYVGDNTDVWQLSEALKSLRGQLLGVISALSDFALKNADVPTLAYTHFQAAQPTTVGKRATLWLQDFLMDFDRLTFELSRLKPLGCKGTTGTGASFLMLFNGDESKVRALEGLIARKMGFESCVAVSGQTYTRKVDAFVLNVLSGIAQSASKMATDLRLLSHLKEFDEPFESEQVGSSAMAYKRNPMRSERVCSLARYVMTDALNPAWTAATQWMERTLDDSANRRIALPEAFLAADAILTLCRNLISGGRVYPGVMRRHLNEEMPFMATENILMRAVELGGDRQKLHEKIREYSVETAARVKLEGGENDLLDKLKADPAFHLDDAALAEILDVKQFIGCAPSQTRAFVEEAVRPVLEACGAGDGTDEVRV